MKKKSPRAALTAISLFAVALLVSACTMLTDTTDPEVHMRFTPATEMEPYPSVTVTAEDPESGIKSIRLYREVNGERELLGETASEGSPSGDAGDADEGMNANFEAQGPTAYLHTMLEPDVYDLVAIVTNGVGRIVEARRSFDLTSPSGESDTTPPVVSISSITPRSGSNIDTGELAINYVVEDDHLVDRVRLSVAVDGGDYALLEVFTVDDVLHVGSFIVEEGLFSVGESLQFKVSATDRAKNEGVYTSQVLNVISTGPERDITPPVVEAYGLSPVSAGTITREELTLNYHVEDNEGLASVKLEASVNDDDFKLLDMEAVTGVQHSGAFSIDGTAFEYGDSLTFRVEVRDEAGNIERSEVGPIPVVERPDGAPTLTISDVRPSVNGLLNKEPVSIDFFADDDGEVRSVELFVSINGGPMVKKASQGFGSGQSRVDDTLVVNLNSPDFEYDDVVQFTLEVTDNAGNKTSVDSPAYVIRDQEAPVVEFLSPQGSFEGDYVSVAVRASDNDEITSFRLRVNGSVVGPVVEDGDFYHYGLDLADARIGVNTLTAIVEDASGNVTSETLTVTLQEDDD